MKLNTLASRLESAGFNVEEHKEKHVGYEGEYETISFSAKSEETIATWRRQGDNASSVYIKNIKTDYWSGYFCETIRDVVNGLLGGL